MACLRCGECCKHVTFNVAEDKTGKGHDRQWMELHGITVTKTQAIVNADCQWLVYDGSGTAYCRDYENRPRICRKWSCERAKVNRG